MASLKELKGRINSVKSTQKITKAKQMVAAAKLRKAQAAAEAARPYASRLAAVMGSIAGKVTVSESSPKLLAGTGKDQVHLLVVANSDKGLCGAFNSNVVKAALSAARELEGQGKTVLFYLIGRKGRAVIRRAYPKAVLASFDTTSVREPGYAEAEAIADELMALYDEGKFDVAHLFYSKFKSALQQDPTQQQIVPVPTQSAATKLDAGAGSAVDYEPEEEAILAALLPRYLRTQLFGALLENSASEQGASMTAMDNATRNAGELINKLTIQYNRSRQAAITTELIEIIAGAEAL
ncbi:F0F1 ATP synthase subunit gamma [Novosphingobium sp.]|uniref:F0F1 ATP synthase subunit gamma n=1 Tax=Novosphingobium sp. TaxID=1874826 RepID=UPI0025F1EDCE|nr:F0F1 ATP synthase subunit gamma [Novosphingobium sp.]MCC6924789.1 F0F1 ATP synthase subunit gamma [Novosphingobium sp.]